MSYVSEVMKELHAIVAELKVVNANAKALRARKKDLESKVLAYLEDVDSPGLKFKDLIVTRSESVTHARLKKKEKQELAIKALEAKGVEDAEHVYQAIAQAAVGAEV